MLFSSTLIGKNVIDSEQGIKEALKDHYRVYDVRLIERHKYRVRLMDGASLTVSTDIRYGWFGGEQPYISGIRDY